VANTKSVPENKFTEIGEKPRETPELIREPAGQGPVRRLPGGALTRRRLPGEDGQAPDAQDSSAPEAPTASPATTASEAQTDLITSPHAEALDVPLTDLGSAWIQTPGLSPSNLAATVDPALPSGIQMAQAPAAVVVSDAAAASGAASASTAAAATAVGQGAGLLVAAGAAAAVALAISAQQDKDITPPTLVITSDKAALKAGETAVITFTFSEDPGASFTASDVVVAGGSLGAISGTGLTRTATFTPTAGLASGNASITVAASTYTDAAGNSGGAGTTPSISIDTLAPTLAITSDKTALKAGETAVIAFTFSEDPGASFTASDLVVSGGSLGAISGTGLTRTATFTPNAGLASGNASITVAASTYTDAAGNSGGAGTTPSISIDTLAPTLAITSDKAALKAGETAAITFTFSEDPGASFTASDLVVAGGSLGALSGTGLTRTATFTPTAGLASGNASITVAASAYTDAAGNSGGAGTTPSLSIDTLAPTLAITSDKAALKAGETATITFTFSEDPGNTFGADDVVLTGGSLGAISGTGLVRTAVFTPTADLTGVNASITVAAGRYSDGAGNSGAAASTPAVSLETRTPADIVTQDGYLDNAELWIDMNDDDVVSSGDTLFGISVNGRVVGYLTAEQKLHALITRGGTDISTGLPFGGSYSATAGSTVVNPLTTMVQSIVRNSLSLTEDMSQEERQTQINEAKNSAMNKVSTALGLPADIDLTHVDAIAASTETGNDSESELSLVQALEINSASLRVANILAVGAAALSGASTETGDEAPTTIILSNFIVDSLVQAIQTAASSGEALNLGNANNLNAILSAAGEAARQDIPMDEARLTQATETVSTAVASTNTLIDTLTGNAKAASERNSSPNSDPNPSSDSFLIQILAAQKTAMEQINDIKTGDTVVLTNLSIDFADPMAVLQKSLSMVNLKLGTVEVTAPTAIAPDSQAPSVIAVNVNPERVGDLAQFVIKMSEGVVFSGTDLNRPTLVIQNTSDGTAEAVFDSARSGGEKLVFTYRVQPGDTRLGLANDAQITLPAGASIKDLSGNDALLSLASGLDDFSAPAIDGQAPSIQISAAQSFVKAGESTVLTFTVNEKPTSWGGAAFGPDDITVKEDGLEVQGRLSDFTMYVGANGAPPIYTAKLTPASATSTTQVSVGIGKFTDVAGNSNSASNLVIVGREAVAPAVNISAEQSLFNLGNNSGPASTVLRFELSQASSSFTADDVTVTGSGTLSGFEGSGTDYSATLSGITSDTRVQVGASRFTAAAGGADNLASNALSFTVDAVAPTVEISISSVSGATITTLKPGEPAKVVFTLSEEAVGFGPQALRASGGYLSDFKQDARLKTQWSAVFNPAAIDLRATSVPPATIQVDADRFTDLADNTNIATPIVKVDPVAPTLAISSSKPALKTGESAVITFSFSEDPRGTFSASDVVVAGGSLGAISGTGLTRTATFTPTAGLALGNASITVAASTYTDAAGNSGGAGTTPSISIDTLAPTLAITSDKAALKAGETAVITFTFSEDPGASFTASDVVVAGGSLGAIGGTGLTRTATFTPTAGLNADSASITVAASVYTDAAGNGGSAGDEPSVSIDTAAPKVTSVTEATTAAITKDPISFTVTFSEALTGTVGTSSFTATNGTVTSVTPAEANKAYTVLVTPTAGVASDAVELSLVGKGLADAAGNAVDSASLANFASQSVDTLAPLPLDLDSNTVGTQDSQNLFYLFSDAGTGKTLVANMATSDDTDIAQIRITVSGAGLDAANDQLLLGDDTVDLNTTAQSGSETLGSVSVDWRYSMGQVLTLSKTDGGVFSSADVQAIEQALQFKTGAAAAQGDRNFTISHIDGAGNESASATLTTAVDTRIKVRVVDGPVDGAKVYVDLDDDGFLDEGEPEVGSTGSTGFADVLLTAQQAQHGLLAKGGTDTETNKAFAGVLTAPEGSTVINPLTTLLAAMMERGQPLADAQAAVVTALGLTGVSDLTSYDTFAQASINADGMANHLKAVQIANIIVAGSAFVASDNTAGAQIAAASKVMDGLAAKIASTAGSIVFNEEVLTAVLTTARSSTHAASVAAAIESVNTVVANASGADAMARVAQAQVLAQVTLAKAIKTAATGGLATVIALQDSTVAAQMASRIDARSTDAAAPDRPDLALGVGVDDGANAAEAAAGAITIMAEDKANVQVTFSNGNNSVTKALTGTGAAQGVALSADDIATLGNGTITVSAVATDAAGNASSAGTSSFMLSLLSITSPDVATPLDENVASNARVYTATSSQKGVTFTLSQTAATLGDATTITQTTTNRVTDDLGEGVTLTRNTTGPMISSLMKDGVTPTIGWNSDGWANLSNVAGRSYSSFADALNNKVSEYILPAELVIHDRVNNTYFTVDFTQYQGGGSGGAFSYQRSQITLSEENNFSINEKGEVFLTISPDYEDRRSYEFTVVATEASGKVAQKTVGLAINNLDESAPEITSGKAARTLVAGTGANQVVYTTTSDDSNDISTGPVTYSLAAPPQTVPGDAVEVNLSSKSFYRGMDYTDVIAPGVGFSRGVIYGGFAVTAQWNTEGLDNLEHVAQRPYVIWLPKILDAVATNDLSDYLEDAPSAGDVIRLWVDGTDYETSKLGNKLLAGQELKIYFDGEYANNNGWNKLPSHADNFLYEIAQYENLAGFVAGALMKNSALGSEVWYQATENKIHFYFSDLYDWGSDSPAQTISFRAGSGANEIEYISEIPLEVATSERLVEVGLSAYVAEATDLSLARMVSLDISSYTKVPVDIHNIVLKLQDSANLPAGINFEAKGNAVEVTFDSGNETPSAVKLSRDTVLDDANPYGFFEEGRYHTQVEDGGEPNDSSDGHERQTITMPQWFFDPEQGGLRDGDGVYLTGWGGKSWLTVGGKVSDSNSNGDIDIAEIAEALSPAVKAFEITLVGDSGADDLVIEWNAPGNIWWTAGFDARFYGEATTPDRALIMHDIFTDRYYKLSSASGGGYLRTEILSNGTLGQGFAVSLETLATSGDFISGSVTLRVPSDSVSALESLFPAPTVVWNDEGWDDLSDVASRTYKVEVNGGTATTTEWVMHDTVNDTYYTVDFSKWSNGNFGKYAVGGGGGFAYERRQIDLTSPSTPALGESVQVFVADGAQGPVDRLDSGAALTRLWAFPLQGVQTIEWNADGWGQDLTDVATRNYTPNMALAVIPDPNDYEGLGNVVLDREWLMHDLVNDSYYKVQFQSWQQDEGGGFAYTRSQIDIETGELLNTVEFAKSEDTPFDLVDTGVVISRGMKRPLNSSGIEWNGEGWDDLEGLASRDFYSVSSDARNGDWTDTEFVMRDLLSGRYYKIDVTDWQEGGGGAVSYERSEIIQQLGETGLTMGDFAIDPVTGEVRLLVDPLPENSPYKLIVVATDAAGNESHQDVGMVVQPNYAPVFQRVNKGSSAPAGLVAYWTMNEGTGTVAKDSSPNHLDAYLMQNASWAANGAPGFPADKSVSLENLGNSYLQVPDNPLFDLNQGFTISAWARPTDDNSNTIIDRGHYSYLFQIGANGRPGLGFYNSNTGWLYSNTPIDVGAWVHVAVSWDPDSDTIKLFKDGVLTDTFSNISSLYINSGELNIGRQSPNADRGNEMDGQLDEVAIYNRALSQAQINRLKQDGALEKDAVAFVNLAEGIAYQANASDANAGTVLTYGLLDSGDAALFTIDAATGAVRFKASPNMASPLDADGDNIYNITVTASDGVNKPTEVPVSIEVLVPPTIAPAASANANENVDGVVYTAQAVGQHLSYSLDGEDAARFAIDAGTGALRFVSPPDFENPSDSDEDNVYNVTAVASTYNLQASQQLAITVANVLEAPVMVGDEAVETAENSTGTVYTAKGTAEASGTLTYTLGGTDAALFSIDANSGAIAFLVAPNFEDPLDDNGDNLYDLTVTASDGTLSSAPKSVEIAVTNVVEPSSVSVTVSPAQVAEGDATNLVYTFTRSGDIGTALIVNIGYGGTASAGTDYAFDGPFGKSWSTLVGGSRQDKLLSIAATPDGGFYAVGQGEYYSASSPMTSADGVVQPFFGWSDAFISKYNASGVQLWNRVYGDASNYDEANSVTVDSAGFAYVVGYGKGTSGAGTNTTFVTKYSPSGDLDASWELTNLQPAGWHRRSVILTSDESAALVLAGGLGSYGVETSVTNVPIGPTGFGTPTSLASFTDRVAKAMATTSDGSIYLTGYTEHAIESQSYASGGDAFLSKLSGDGTVAWSRLIGGSSWDSGTSVVVDSDGGVYVAGFIDTSYFVNKYDANGASVWSTTIANGSNYASSLAIGSDGFVYLSGITTQAIDGQAALGGNDAFVTRIDPESGQRTFTRILGSDGDDRATTIAAGPNGAIVIGGTAYKSYDIVYDGLQSLGNSDGFVTQFAPPPLPSTVTFAAGSTTATLALKTKPDELTEGTETVTVTVMAGQGYAAGAASSASGTIEDNLPPVITSANTVSVAEGSSGTVYTAIATDANAGSTLSYGIEGADAARFNINAQTGAVSFKVTPDFEAPTDGGSNNIYDFTVTASDGINTSQGRAVAITVLNANEAPVNHYAFQSDLGGLKWTSVGDYAVHSFTTVGTSTFTLDSATPVTMEALVVAGGAAGAWSSNLATGGGGGGGVAHVPALPLSGGTYTVTVGSGGIAVPGAGNYSGTTYNGGDSSIVGSNVSVIVYGGGGGGGFGGDDGVAGGSGGGGHWSNGQGGTPTPGIATGIASVSFYGHAGGQSDHQYSGGGGGGGATTAGADATPGAGGAGGQGLTSTITGTAVVYGSGGGGAGSNSSGLGGSNGGNAATVGSPATSGVANTGGGGGAGGDGSSGRQENGSGGSGIVVLRYVAGIEAEAGTPHAVEGIQIGDPDAAGSYTVTFTQTHGVLAVLENVPDGLLAEDISGNRTASVSLTGTLAQINATLAAADGLVLTMDDGFSGAATLTMATNDGQGGTDTDAIAVNVTAPVVDSTGPTLGVSTSVVATSFEESSLISALKLDIPNPNLASITLDTTNDELDFSASGNTDMWSTRGATPIAYLMSPQVALNASWSIETRVRINDRGQTEQNAGLTFYADQNGARPAFTYGMTGWDGNWRINIEDFDYGGQRENAGYGFDSAYLKVEVTEKGASDDYRFFYKQNSSDSWTQLGGASHVFTSSADNARTGLWYKTGGAKPGAAFDELKLVGGDVPPWTLATSTIAGSAGNSAGETIALTLTFDGVVNGLTTGTDSTTFTVAGTGVSAAWSGTGSTRTLTYTIAAGQNGQVAINETALKATLIAGIKDGAGNAFAYNGNIPNIDASALPVIEAPVERIQYATAVTASSGFNDSGPGYGALIAGGNDPNAAPRLIRHSKEQVLGSPDSSDTGDGRAWAPLTADNPSDEWIEVGFSGPAYAESVLVRQMPVGASNGFVSKIELIDINNGYHTVFEGADPHRFTSSQAINSRFDFPRTDYLVKGAKVHIETSGTHWEIVDSIALVGFDSPSFNAATDFMAGPSDSMSSKTQSTGSQWQYFSADYVASNISNLQLLSDWDTSLSGVIRRPQWDGNRAYNLYPLVQKQENGALIIHPDSTDAGGGGKAVVVAWKNTTSSNVTVDLTGSLSLVGDILDTYAPNNLYSQTPSNDGIAYSVTTSSTAYASGTPTILLQGALDEESGSSSPSSTNLNLSNQTLAPGAMISVAVHGNGNFSWDFTQLDLQITPEPLAGQSVVDLGSLGQLIAPVQVEGRWYYHLDRNGDGTIAGDAYTMSDASTYPLSEIYDLFKQDVNGVAGSSTNDTYRYATVSGVKLALPTLGTSATQGLMDGTALADPSQTNPSYDDLSAIWDAYNGTLVGSYSGQGLNGSNRGSGNITSGAPGAWVNDSYVSATPWPSSTDYAALRVYDGLVFNHANWVMNVALQVL